MAPIPKVSVWMLRGPPRRTRIFSWSNPPPYRAHLTLYVSPGRGGSIDILKNAKVGDKHPKQGYCFESKFFVQKVTEVRIGQKNNFFHCATVDSYSLCGLPTVGKRALCISVVCTLRLVHVVLVNVALVHVALVYVGARS